MIINNVFSFNIILLIINNVKCADWVIVRPISRFGPFVQFRPCQGNDQVSGIFESSRPTGERNQYYMFIRKSIGRKYPSYIPVVVKFNTNATVSLPDSTSAPCPCSVLRQPQLQLLNDGSFRLWFDRDSGDMAFHVRGLANGPYPYINSLAVNGEEFCNQTGVYGPHIDYDLILGVRDTLESVSAKINPSNCGRRIIKHTELITSSSPTKAGDWPWHAAIYRYERNALLYKCGGTLISKNAVLTAAHCTTIRGAPVLPEVFSVVLGKYNLYGGDISSQEREVFQVIVHESFNATSLNNDISILKLKTEAVYNEYVQPACVWEPPAYEILKEGQLYGTVVGWGFDQTDRLSLQLRKATIPKVSEITCLRSNPMFFDKLLNDNKFCAGFRNETSACNGDSGGGFTVFIPDTVNDVSEDAPGSWYVRGIVSTAVSRSDANICDPTEYTLFTDVAKYRDWIRTVVN